MISVGPRPRKIDRPPDRRGVRRRLLCDTRGAGPAGRSGSRMGRNASANVGIGGCVSPQPTEIAG